MRSDHPTAQKTRSKRLARRIFPLFIEIFSGRYRDLRGRASAMVVNRCDVEVDVHLDVVMADLSAQEASEWPLWTRKDVEQETPSRKDGISFAKETQCRRTAGMFLAEAGKNLKVYATKHVAVLSMAD